ncbi:XisI protein [Haliscomenobacter sp.]|jgi:XisI protein|uniref:XisI protein n=1 Tax=Haliscomenobacter sp. TaxID=2717303 RepID=UPI00336515D1
MEKVAHYQQIIKSILDDYTATMPSNLDEEVYLVEDKVKMNYLIYHNAWKQNSRSYGCILHVRIKNEKVYVEYDGTDEGFADLFAEAGIPKQDIVLAFHAPAKRQYTGFAVA